jgi:hypothetical protein
MELAMQKNIFKMNEEDLETTVRLVNGEMIREINECGLQI